MVLPMNEEERFDFEQKYEEYLPISQQAKNKRKVKQNEEKRKEVINFRTISGNPRQFNYRDESAGLRTYSRADPMK